MHDLTIRIDDMTHEWIEHNRGDMSCEEFVSRAIREYISNAKDADINARLHECIIGRMERSIERLNEGLQREQARIHSR